MELAKFSDHKDDANAWTVEQCVEDALADIKAGKIDPRRCVLIFEVDSEDGKGTKVKRWFAGICRQEAVGLLEVAKAMEIQEIFGW